MGTVQGVLEQLVREAHSIYEAAVCAAQPRGLLRTVDMAERLRRPLSSYRRLVVVGAGKASMAMAGAIEEGLEATGLEGLVVVPHGYWQTLPASQRAPEQVEVVEAGHPVPDEAGVQAAQRVLELAEACGEDDLLLVLLSGGGSALWPAVAPGLSLADVQAVSRLVLESGATIHEINAVRKHLSRVGGGRLVAAAYPATVLTLALSDVVGDDLSVIASGPTVPDPSTFSQAAEVLRRYGLWGRVPSAVRGHVERGLAGTVSETPKPGDAVFERAQMVLLGSNRNALEAAREEAERRGYRSLGIEEAMTGEAREVGRSLAATALGLLEGRPSCLLWGGETTVTVRGKGRGGRNQEVALAAALELDSAARPVVLLSGGTDGIDGPTDAAGAWATPQTAPSARHHGLDPEAYLQNNDAYAFFDQLGMLLRPGPTHTNVMDIQIALMLPA